MRTVFALVTALAAVALPTPASAAEPAAPALTRPPELVTFVEAVFPPEEAGHTGAVVLAITIAADGTVEDATVQESASPAFDAAAVEAARRFVFTPAEVDGVPSRIRIEYRYEFVEEVELEVPTTAAFQGVVRDRSTKTPVGGITVRLADGREVVTSDDGAFRFDEVAPGTLTVTLEGDRLTALQTDETFVAGEQLDATYDVFLLDEGEEADDLDLLVVAPTIRREAVSTEIPAEEARRVPGTQGDVLRVVESLPGVARASLGTGALVVWGAAPDDTGVYVDGVPVPRLYHDGGLRSVVGSEFVESVALVPGGYGAAYGRGLGGLVTVTTRRFDEEVHGAFSADLYDGQVSIGGPVDDTVSLALTGRYGWVGPLLSSFAPDVQDVFPVPNYRDGAARLGLRLGPAETLDFTVLASSDHTTRTAPNPDPSREAAEDKSLAFQRVSARWVSDPGDGSTRTALVYFGGDQSAQIATFGSTTTELSADTWLAGARLSHRARVGGHLTFEGGLDAHVPWTRALRTGSTGLPAREGDILAFGQPPPDRVASDTFDVVQVNLGPYAEADVAVLDDRLHVVPGLRFDPSFRSVSRAAPQVGISPTRGLYLWDPHLEPRLMVRADPTDTFGFTAAGGGYAQPPAATDLSAAFGNPQLPLARGRHALVQVRVRPVEALSVEVTAFRTSADDLAMRNGADQPAAAEALSSTGESRTIGIQSLVRLEPTGGAFGWISYTLAKADRRASRYLDWRPSDYDQRHVLTALLGLELPAEFEFGVRGRVSSGFPRTPVTGAYLDARRDLYQPTFGEQNTAHLPAFFQLDARVARTFRLRESELDVSFEVQNLTNRANVEDLVYSADWSQQGAIRGLPLLPVLGLRWSF